MTYALVETTTLVPRQEHWVILCNATINIPGDERSRTAPGHGYPAHARSYLEYRAYTLKEQFLEDLEKLYRQKPDRGDIVAIHVAGIVEPTLDIKFVFEGA